MTFREANRLLHTTTDEARSNLHVFGIKTAGYICENCKHEDCSAHIFYYYPIIECKFYKPSK